MHFIRKPLRENIRQSVSGGEGDSGKENRGQLTFAKQAGHIGSFTLGPGIPEWTEMLMVTCEGGWLWPHGGFPPLLAGWLPPGTGLLGGLKAVRHYAAGRVWAHTPKCSTEARYLTRMPSTGGTRRTNARGSAKSVRTPVPADPSSLFPPPRGQKAAAVPASHSFTEHGSVTPVCSTFQMFLERSHASSIPPGAVSLPPRSGPWPHCLFSRQQPH